MAISKGSIKGPKTKIKYKQWWNGLNAGFVQNAPKHLADSLIARGIAELYVEPEEGEGDSDKVETNDTNPVVETTDANPNQKKAKKTAKKS